MEIRMELTERDVVAIKDVGDTKDIDFVTIKSDGDGIIRFIAYNSEVVKVYEKKIEGFEDLINLRIIRQSFLAPIQEGSLVIKADDTKVTLISYKKGKVVPSLGVEVGRQREIDPFLNTINKFIDYTTVNRGFQINNLQNLNRILGFCKLSKSGVIMSRGLAFTLGNGYRVACETGCTDLNAGLTTQGVEQIVKYGVYFKKAKGLAWDVSNYLVFKFDDMYVCIKKARLEESREMQEILKMKPLFTETLQYTELSSFLKGIKVTEPLKTTVNFSFEKKTISVSDRNYGKFKMIWESDKEYKYKLSINCSLLQSIMPYMKSKDSTLLALRVYENFVCLVNSNRIFCYMNGDGDYVV